ncbi:hypothetical protein ABPG72_014593 [Tetrahymena utriculariae]
MSYRVYIGKTAGVSKEDLFALCQTFGSISDFMMKETYAFVEYSNEIDAKKAVIELDGRFINGHRIMAEPAKIKGVSENVDLAQHPRIYVGRLQKSVQREDLLNLFGRYGEITDIMRKEDYAFIEFGDSSFAAQAVKEMNGYNLNGTNIVVEGARPKDEAKEIKTTRLYIGKIGPQIKKQDLVITFGGYGELVDILMKDDYAFVEFTTTHAAAKALASMNGARLAGTKIVVEEARPKEGAAVQTQTSATTKRVPLNPLLQQQQLFSSTDASSSQAAKFNMRGRRLSPRRSISRSRSRSYEKKNNKKI